MHTTIDCIGEHEIKIDLPNKVFARGPLVLPCPTCGVRYIVREDGSNELFEREPLRFLAMHY